ncbi:enolase 1, partial [Tanacetum coccineum]
MTRDKDDQPQIMAQAMQNLKLRISHFLIHVAIKHTEENCFKINGYLEWRGERPRVDRKGGSYEKGIGANTRMSDTNVILLPGLNLKQWETLLQMLKNGSGDCAMYIGATRWKYRYMKSPLHKIGDNVTTPVNEDTMVHENQTLRDDDTLSSPQSPNVDTEEQIQKENLTRGHHKHWRSKMDSELEELEHNRTWIIEELPSNKKALGCKWVYKIKYKSDRTIERFKARLVILVAASKQWELHQMDVPNVFLHGDLEAKVFMRGMHTSKVVIWASTSRMLLVFDVVLNAKELWLGYLVLNKQGFQCSKIIVWDWLKDVYSNILNNIEDWSGFLATLGLLLLVRFGKLGFRNLWKLLLWHLWNYGLGNLRIVGLGSSSRVGLRISGNVGIGITRISGLGTTGTSGLGITGTSGLGIWGISGFGISGSVGFGILEKTMELPELEPRVSRALTGPLAPSLLYAWGKEGIGKSLGNSRIVGNVVLGRSWISGNFGTSAFGRFGSSGLGISGTVGFGISGTTALGISVVGFGSSGRIVGLGSSSRVGLRISGNVGIGITGISGLGTTGTSGLGITGTSGLGIWGISGFGISGSVGFRISGNYRTSGFGSSGASKSLRASPPNFPLPIDDKVMETSITRNTLNLICYGGKKFPPILLHRMRIHDSCAGVFGCSVVIGMDVAASEFYGEKDKTYDLNFKEENNNGKEKISGEQLKDLYKPFVSEYPIVSIEGSFDQDDWEHYGKRTAEWGEHVQIVGDDLLVTNPTVRITSLYQRAFGPMVWRFYPPRQGLMFES